MDTRDQIHGLEKALRALCPRLYLTREDATDELRITVASPLHKSVAFELIPLTAVGQASVKELEAIVKRLVEGCVKEDHSGT